MPFVVDASMTLAWYFAGEATPYTIAIRALLRQSHAVAPAIWPLEVGNGLVLGERRGRLSHAQVERILSLLNLLPIEVEPAAVSLISGSVVPLARQLGLTVYDASYLELAARRGLSLATVDARLQAAAARIGVAITPAPGDSL